MPAHARRSAHARPLRLGWVGLAPVLAAALFAGGGSEALVAPALAWLIPAVLANELLTLVFVFAALAALAYGLARLEGKP